MPSISGAVIKGKASEPVMIDITTSGAEIIPASHLWEKTVHETTEILLEGSQVGKKPCVLCIGPAGEKLVRIASVMNDKNRAYGRCGPGAVFGAHLRAWNYDGTAVSAIDAVNLFAYPPADYRYGVRLATLDLDNDGRAEILTIPGPDPARPARVRAWRVAAGSTTMVETVDFDAYADLQLTWGGSVAGGRF